MYLFFVVGQYIRARLEEKKLRSVFREYSEYKSETGMFFPRLF
jgi:protein-S-isoprenylcysteine O-methyltransferase Ste14